MPENTDNIVEETPEDNSLLTGGTCMKTIQISIRTIFLLQ
mgnify:CR=1 FL=1